MPRARYRRPLYFLARKVGTIGENFASSQMGKAFTAKPKDYLTNNLGRELPRYDH